MQPYRLKSLNWIILLLLSLTAEQLTFSLFQCPLLFLFPPSFPLQLHISRAVFLARIDTTFITIDSRNIYHIKYVDCKFRPLSLQNFLYFSLTSVYRGPNILLNTLHSITLSLYSNLGIKNLLKKEAVPYQSSAKVSLLLPLLLIYLAVR